MAARPNEISDRVTKRCEIVGAKCKRASFSPFMHARSSRFVCHWCMHAYVAVAKKRTCFCSSRGVPTFQPQSRHWRGGTRRSYHSLHRSKQENCRAEYMSSLRLLMRRTQDHVRHAASFPCRSISDPTRTLSLLRSSLRRDYTNRGTRSARGAPRPFFTPFLPLFLSAAPCVSLGYWLSPSPYLCPLP
jgi:hypothetical protein